MKIAIIGSGSAAFSAAIYAADHGAQVFIIENNILGGTCVNVGCVPSKIFIRSAQLAHDQAHHPFAGLSKSLPAVDRGTLLKQQQLRVEELRNAKYHNILEQYDNIEYIKGFASFADKNTLLIQTSDRVITLITDKVLIASGSSPITSGISGLNGTPFWTSTEALESPILPKHLIVVGASVVAIELAQAFLRLGSEVTMLARSTLLSKEDPYIGEVLSKILQEEGMKILEHAQIDNVRFEEEEKENSFSLSLQGSTVIKGDKLLVATGRKANTEKLGLETIGVHTDSQGQVLVNEYMQTSVDNIYAAGDCTTNPKYVYIAAAGGTRAAANMLGSSAKLDLSVVPRVVFSDPQVATVGLTEEQALEQGLSVVTKTLSMTNVPRSLANFDTRGFIKLIAEAETGKLVGAHILCPEASEIIQIAALAISNGMTVKALSAQFFPYLTMAEGIKLCAQTFSKDVSKLSCCADALEFDEEEFIDGKESKKPVIEFCCSKNSQSSNVASQLEVANSINHNQPDLADNSSSLWWVGAGIGGVVFGLAGLVLYEYTDHFDS